MNQRSGITNIAGHPISVPNSTLDGNGFYISFNETDINIYGCETTALVSNKIQMENFYILNGDHRTKYADLMNKGFDACFDYFKANIGQINKYSDKIPLDTPTAKPSMRAT